MQVSIRELIDNRGWLSKLAQRLIRDPHAAEDAVQETLLIAVDRTPLAVGGSASLRAWLTKVLRSRINLLRRGESRRYLREQRAVMLQARRPDLASIADVEDRLELTRRVLDAVSALDETHRRVLMLTCYYDVSAAEIARECGVPSSTIRSQLQRAIAMVRRKLDRDYKDRKTWAVALSPLASASPLLEASRWTTASLLRVCGGILVETKKLVAMSLLVLVVVGGVFFQFSRPGANSTAPERQGESAALVEAERPKKAPIVPSARPGPLATIASGAVSGPESLATKSANDADATVAVAAEPAVIRGRIWRTDGLSLEGADLVFAGREQLRVKIDADGYFELTTTIIDGLSLFLDTGGYSIELDRQVRPIPGAEVALEVEIDAGHEIEVWLTDATDGEPITHSRIAILRAGLEGQSRCTYVRIQDDGVARAELLPAGPSIIRVDIDGYESVEKAVELPTSSPIRIELKPARALQVSLQGYAEFPPQERIVVMFFQLPVDGASAISSFLDGTPDAAGDFFVAAPAAGKWRYQLSGSEGFPACHGEFVVPEGTVPVHLSIALPAPGRVRVVANIVDELGSQLPGGRIQIGEVEAPIDEDGVAQLDGVHAGRQAVSLRTGSADHEIDRVLPPLDVPEATEFAWTFVVPGEASLVAWVADLPAELLAWSVMFVVERLESGDTAVVVARGSAGAHERVQFDRLPVGRYRVSPILSHNSIIELQPVEVTVRSAKEPFEARCDYRAPASFEVRFLFESDVSVPRSVRVQCLQAGRTPSTHFLTPGETPSLFRIHGEGQFELIFLAEGFEDVRREAFARPGAVVALEVSLRKAR
ncbi:MAG: RNA polymerase sigma factor [Planctomycetota bacterium]